MNKFKAINEVIAKEKGRKNVQEKIEERVKKCVKEVLERIELGATTNKY